MKNAAIEIALTFALATTAVSAAIAWRQASVADVIKASRALNAGAAATATKESRRLP